MDKKIIDKKSALQSSILKILIKQHINGYIDSTQQGLNTIQIINILKSKGFNSDEPESQVKQALYIIKKKVTLIYGKEVSNNFITSSKYSGQYRLGNKVTVLCF